jgi:2-dehydropantoate 2-reductase
VKVLIAGTGGVGGYFGARLLQAGHEVWFLARGPNLAALRDSGLTVESPHGDARIESVNAVADGSGSGPVDAVMVCVKTYDNDAAAAAIAPAVRPGTAVCSLQNGVDNESFFGERLPDAVVLGGVARIEAWLEAPGLVRQKGPLQDLAVGAFDPGHHPAAEAMAKLFEGTGVPVAVVQDIRSALWFKLLGICGVGGITAYCRCAIGPAREDPDLRALMVAVFEEVEAVAEGLDVALPPTAASMLAAGVDALDPTLKSSMCRDVERGRPLEVEALNGAVVGAGERVGVATPANRTILEALLPLHLEALARRGG